MLSLAETQGNFIETINDGPDVLNPALFAGPVNRVLLGLKAHANTINHARLVALEETFPLTRQEMGEAAFNQLSRHYVDTEEARAADANHLGRDFADFLNRHGARAAIVDLANIEWAWLESYHAADAAALTLADLTDIDETTLLEMGVALHPSARIITIHAPLASALEGYAGQQPAAILTIRPDTEVRLIALDQFQADLLAQAGQQNCTFGNLLALTLEQTAELAPLEPILHLIGAGALVKTE
jgi:hypothetical protein